MCKGGADHVISTGCHLQCHDYHVLLSGDSMSPCTGRELVNDVYNLLFF